MANTVFGLKGTIATKSAVQSVASSATAAIVTFDLETYDTSGDTEAVKFHSITTNTGRFYAVEDGFYELSATVKFAAIAAAGRVALGYSIDAGADVETVEQVTSATSSTPGLFMKKFLRKCKRERGLNPPAPFSEVNNAYYHSTDTRTIPGHF